MMALISAIFLFSFAAGIVPRCCSRFRTAAFRRLTSGFSFFSSSLMGLTPSVICSLDEFGVKSDEMCAETLGEGDRAVDQVIGLPLTLHDGKHRFVGHGEPPSYGFAPI